MQMQNLRTAFAQMQQQRKPLVEFKAGICDFSLAETKVIPDKRKGKLIITQSPAGELKLQWKLRPSGTVDWHRLLLAGSATWEKVPECTTGRCFLLRFKQGNAMNKLKFFWMQEPKDDKDEEYLKKINEIIENPPPPPANPMAGMNQAQIMRMLAGQLPGQSTGGRQQQNQPTTGLPNTGGSSNNTAQTNANNDTNNDRMRQVIARSYADLIDNQPKLSLNEILDSSRVINALDEDDMKRLLEYLPESQRDFNNLRETLRSPQIKQTYSRLSSVLNGPQFNSVMMSMGLSHAGTLGVGAFLDSIQADANKKKSAEKKKEDNENNTNEASKDDEKKNTQ